MDFLVDAARTLLLLLAVTLAMLLLKFAWAGHRERDSLRAWGATAVLLLLMAPAHAALLRFGEPLRGETLIYAAALACGCVAMRKMYTVHPEWTRVRLAEEREKAATELAEVRDEQDTLRAADRTYQAGERRDSRDMFDAGHLGESEATYDRRIERREAQDENRAHSHKLQDEERATARRDEDDRL